jgi:hypothetical protein
MPVPSEAPLQLLEQHADGVDQLAELPPGAHGVTLYYWDRQPSVWIDAQLTRQPLNATTGLECECPVAIELKLVLPTS